jgi:hypothetical protein
VKASITIEIDTESLSSRTDSHLAFLWHLTQANPAPYGDREAGAIAERVGREIILRWITKIGPELWQHQGTDHFLTVLQAHGSWPGPDHREWVYDPAKAAGGAP